MITIATLAHSGDVRAALLYAVVMVADLPPRMRATWRAEAPYATGQPLGEAVVHFCLRILCLDQVVCFAQREGNTAPPRSTGSPSTSWPGRPIAC